MTAPLQLDFQSDTQPDLCYSQIMQTTGIHSHKYMLKEKGQSSKPKLAPKANPAHVTMLHLYKSAL